MDSLKSSAVVGSSSTKKFEKLPHFSIAGQSDGRIIDSQILSSRSYRTPLEKKAIEQSSLNVSDNTTPNVVSMTKSFAKMVVSDNSTPNGNSLTGILSRQDYEQNTNNHDSTEEKLQSRFPSKAKLPNVRSPRKPPDDIEQLLSGPSVGISQQHDLEEVSLFIERFSNFCKQVKNVADGIKKDDCKISIKAMEILHKQHQSFIDILNGPTKIGNACNYTVQGFGKGLQAIREYLTPDLVRTKFLLEYSIAHLKSIPIPNEHSEEQLAAMGQAGLTIAKWFKVKFTYQTIDAGKKWISARNKESHIPKPSIHQNTIEMVSKNNIAWLLSELKPFKKEEKAFITSIMTLPFTIKHATQNWYRIANDGRLESTYEFKKRNQGWNSEFSTPGNLKKLGNKGFVFFRVDVGLEEIETRYGDTQVMADLNLIEQQGWISLFDQLNPLSSDSMKRFYDHQGNLLRTTEVGGTNNIYHSYKYGMIPANSRGKKAISFSKTQIKTFTTKNREPKIFHDLNKKEDFSKYVFYGRQIRMGIALSVLHELRFFKQSGYYQYIMKQFHLMNNDRPNQCILSSREIFLKNFISSLFRPEGKLPVALRSTEQDFDQLNIVKPGGDNRWNKDGSENSAIMTPKKLKQKQKHYINEIDKKRKLVGTYQKCAKEKTGQEKLKYCERLVLEKRKLEEYKKRLKQIAKYTD